MTARGVLWGRVFLGAACLGSAASGCGRAGPAREQTGASGVANVPASAGAGKATGADGARAGGPGASPAAGSAPVPAPSQVEPAPGSPAAPATPDRSWTAGITSVERSAKPVQLADVRAARNDGYDRVVFEFRDAVPGYHLEYVDSPVRDCGAGEPRAIAGDAWLEVRLFPALAHTEAGVPTIVERERALSLPIVRELELTCDFEAVVTWVLGVASPHRYSVLELNDPPRLVVDIQH